jgi:hypothetical protein
LRRAVIVCDSGGRRSMYTRTVRHEIRPRCRSRRSTP